MTIDRRKLMAAGGGVFLAAGGTGAHGAEINPVIPGLTIMITKSHKGWMVAVPDWEAAKSPWNAVPEASLLTPSKWIPLEEFLAAFEEASA